MMEVKSADRKYKKGYSIMVITTQNTITSQGPGFKSTESNNLVMLQDKGVLYIEKLLKL